MVGLILEKASIEKLAGAPPLVRIPVLFNPAEYSIERANAYKSTPVPGLGSPLIQFVNGDAATLAMELVVDDFTDPLGVTPDVSSVLTGALAGPPMTAAQRIDAIVGLLDIDRHLHAPPPVRFVWGPLRFDAVLEKVGRKITIFHPSGRPARANLSVSFREFRPLARQLDDPRRESSDKTKRRQILASESVWLIADREYGEVRGWRQIAEASGVDDPRSLVPGAWVKVPPLEGEDAFLRKA